jgi:PAS domain S-box-containing protein/diguanylate cyclase (GGDEF)-like protein
MSQSPSSSHTAARIALAYLALAGLWILASDSVLELFVESAAGNHWGQTLKGLGFVGFTTLLLYLLLRRYTCQGERRDRLLPAPAAWMPVAIFVVFALGLTAAGGFVFHTQRVHLRATSEAQLKAVGDLRIEQVRAWLNSLKTNAEFFGHNSNLAEVFGAWVAAGAKDPAQKRYMLQRLHGVQTAYGYSDVTLFDRQGRPRLGEQAGVDLSEHTQAALRVMASGRSELMDFHLHAGKAEPMLGLIAPMSVDDGHTTRTVGALFYSIPVRQSLFALLGRWPTPSGSGETVLMRRETEGIRILYASRLADSNGLGPLLPMAQSNLVSVRLANGEKGIISGALDYKRQPVITYGEPIADTPWTLVTKIDQREVEAPVEKLARGVALAGGLLLLAAGLAIWLWSRAQVNRQRAQLLGKELERQVLERRFDILSRYANDAFLLVDEQGRILEVNQRVREMSGYSDEELLCASVTLLRPEDLREGVASRLEQTLANGQLLYETILMRKDGSRIPVEVSTRLIEQAGLQRIHISIRDISERKQSEEKLALATYFDALTGLPNARKLLVDATQAIAVLDADSEHLALLVLNLDRFAQLNESLGRAAGDQVLVRLAQRWAAALSGVTMLARLDGDQFAVLWREKHLHGEEHSEAVLAIIALANDLLASMAEPVSIGGESLPVALTLSIGVALYPADAPDAAALLHAAEDAMRKAKAEKGNQVRFFDRAQAQMAIDWFDTEAALRLALERDELFLDYQPQVEASSGRVIAAESLIRWRRDGQVVPPGRFINVVEGTDLAEPVSRWVLQTACRQARQWLDREHPLRVAVNIFSDHVTSGHLLDDVR